MQREVSAFSNPIAPERNDERSAQADGSSQRLTNADFRKLLMTPRAGGAPGQSSLFAAPKAPAFSNEEPAQSSGEKSKNAAAKKRHFLPKSKREELERERELEQQYRDRARERRDREKTDGTEASEYFDEAGNVNISMLQSRSEYRAVPSSSQLSIDARERRRQLIQESKFLGGDMEHTHLVKGLDFALLEKVRTEIDQQERERQIAKIQEQEDRATKGDPSKRGLQAGDQKVRPKAPSNVPSVCDSIECRSAITKRLLRSVFDYQPPERNELFAHGRMSFVFELEDGDGGDLPIAVVRSKAELALANAATSAIKPRNTDGPPAPGADPASQAGNASTQSTNDIVMEKLIQILHGLRTGKRENAISKRMKPTANALAKKQPEKESKKKIDAVDSLFDDDVGDYVPDLRKRPEEKSSGKSKPHRYFEPEREETRHGRSGPDERDNASKSRRQRNTSAGDDEEKSSTALERLKMRTEIDCYVECYPGMAEMDDALVDSDDEDGARKLAAAAQNAKSEASTRKRFDKQRDGAGSAGFFIASGDADVAKSDDSFRIGSSSGGGGNADRQTDAGNRASKRDRGDDKRERKQHAALDREWAQIQSIIERKKTDGGKGSGKSRPEREASDDDDDEPRERFDKRSRLSR